MNSADATPLDFDTELCQNLAKGWTIATDGPSGVQLVGPKKMKLLDQICMVFGIVTLFFFGIGLFFILIAALDYWFLTERPKTFLLRPSGLTPQTGNEPPLLRSHV